MATDRQKLAVAADDYTRLAILAATAQRMLEHGLVDDVRQGLADLERLAGEYAAAIEFHLSFIRPSIHDVDVVGQAPTETGDGEDSGRGTADDGLPDPGVTTNALGALAKITMTGVGHPSTPYPRVDASVVPILRSRAPAATAAAIVEPEPADDDPPPVRSGREPCPLCAKPVSVNKGGRLRRHPCVGVQPVPPSPDRPIRRSAPTRRNEPGGEQTLTRRQALAGRGYTPEDLQRPDPWR